MASIMNAMRAYMPAIKYEKTCSTKTLVKFISARTTMNEGAIYNSLMELKNALIHYGSLGEPIKLDGVGTFTPTLSLDGTFNISFLPDIEVKGGLNAPDGYVGEYKNKDMIGKTQQDIIDRWNNEHPDDPIEEKPKDKDKGKK